MMDALKLYESNQCSGRALEYMRELERRIVELSQAAGEFTSEPPCLKPAIELLEEAENYFIAAEAALIESANKESFFEGLERMRKVIEILKEERE